MKPRWQRRRVPANESKAELAVAALKDSVINFASDSAEVPVH